MKFEVLGMCKHSNGLTKHFLKAYSNDSDSEYDSERLSIWDICV